MSYIGVPPVSGDFVVLDAITTSATASYTLQRSSVNFAPESANHMLVSLNGVREKRNSLLAKTDWTASSDLTMSDEMKTYRQQLRDATEGLDTVEKIEAYTFPTEVTK